MALKFSLFILILTSISCTRKATISKENFLLEGLTSIGTNTEIGTFFTGGFSGIHFSEIESNSNTLIFYAITDAGPKGYRVGDGSSYVLPSYNPEIIRIELNRDQPPRVSDRIPLQNSMGKKFTGILSTNETKAYDTHGNLLPKEIGIDPESIVVKENGEFIVGEEYGPSVLEFSRRGQLKRRWSTTKFSTEKVDYKIPDVFSSMEENRGFEATAYANGWSFSFLQGSPNGKKSLPVLAINNKQGSEMKTLFYPLEKSKNKITASCAISFEEIYVLEQKDDDHRYIYKFSFDPSSSNQEIDKEFVLKIKKKHNLPEKIEGMACMGSNRLVFVNDNDFSIKKKNNEISLRKNGHTYLSVINF
jgi:hypothetical protein